MASIINSTTTAGVTVTGDNSGSLQLATNNGTTAVTIDTSQNIGIGTTTPTGKFEVKSANNTGTDSIIRATSNNGTASTWLTFNGVSVSSGNACVFHNGTTEQMRIDSSGRVTTPAQPAFVAHATGSSNYLSVANGNAFPANATNYNQGSCYNTSNYRFTAPVTGLYFFTFSAIHNNSSSDSRPHFFVNNSGSYNGIQHGINNRDASGSASNATSSLIYLQANDYVFVASSSGSLYYYGSAHSTFSGCLIG